MFGWIVKVGAGLKSAVSLVFKIKQAKKEVEDVVVCVGMLIDKYDDLDDDVKKVVDELKQAVNAIRRIF